MLSNLLNRQRPEEWEARSFRAVLLASAAALVIAGLWIPLPYQIDYVEGPLLAEATSIAHGSPVYPDATAPPYVINPYGPIGYYTFAMLVRIFGVSFTPPRILVFVSSIGCAALVGLLIRRLGGARMVSFVFGALLLAMPASQKWHSLARVDMIALVFSLGGLYLFLKRDRWYLSTILFAAAFFCKFTIVAAPAACFFYLLANQDQKRLLQFAAGYFALIGTGFLIVQSGTGGWFWFDNFLSNRIHPFSMSSAVFSILKELRDCSIILLAAALAIWGARGQQLKKALALPGIYFAVTFLTTIMRGKAGASSNYFLEWEAALCWCGGIGYSFLRSEASIANSRKIGSQLLLACGALAMVVWVTLRRDLPHYESVAGCRDAYRYAKEHPGDRILSENAGAVIMAGKTSGVLDPFVWARQVIQGGWSDVEVVQNIRSRHYDLILVNGSSKPTAFDAKEGRWTEPVIEAIEENYGATHQFACEDANLAFERKQ